MANPYSAAVQSRRRLSSVEVLRMVDLGILRPDEPVELIEGELLLVGPQGPLHASRIMALQRILATAYDGAGSLRVQLPLDSGQDSLPEPDLAIVRGVAEDYAERHPYGTDAILVIEVAHTSQALDRDKARVYAAMGVSDYWIVDLALKRVELRRSPTPDGLYASTQILSLDARLELPGTRRAVAVQELIG